jgi:hypothetical protein
MIGMEGLSMLLAHASPPEGAGLFAGLAVFGADWWYVLGPLGVMAAIAVALGVHGHESGAGVAPLRDFAAGAARLTGLDDWAAASIVVLVGGCVFAVEGFLWDVAWHIALGRDEFLFSPPHICLLLGIGLLGVAGLVGIVRATVTAADVGWRVRGLRVPFGAAMLTVAGGVALTGFGVDELWHAAYGIDVTMWSPPHLSMISAAAFSPMAAWLIMAEAGLESVPRAWRYILIGFATGATLVALSAWQLEFDLGVPQWQQAFHPLLVALAAGFALCAARAALGRGGALLAMVRFVVIRGALLAVVTLVWHLPTPMFVPYVAAAVAVELAFVLSRGRSTAVTGLIAGIGIATLGMAGAAVLTQWWSWNPWTPGLLRSAVPIAATAIAASVLGTAFGNVTARRPGGLRTWQVALSLTAIVVAAGSLLPRTTPDLTVDIRTSETADGFISLDVGVQPRDGAEGADRFQAMAWQGGGLVVAPLIRGEDGRYRTRLPVPVGGDWKTMVRIAQGPDLGAVPVSMPADAVIDAPAVPLQPHRRGPMLPESHVLLREAHSGPTWPALVGYVFVVLSVGAIIGMLVAGTVALDRRRASAPAGSGLRAAAARSAA